MHLSYGIDVANNAKTWVELIRPECLRITETYDGPRRIDITELPASQQKAAWDAWGVFSETFQVSVFNSCKEYQESIDRFNNSSIGIGFEMKSLLEQYQTLYSEANDNKIWATFTQHDSARFKRHNELRLDLRAFNKWLALIGNNPTEIAKWKKQFDKLEASWAALMQEARKDSTAFKRSTFNRDMYKDDSGVEIRNTISRQIESKYKFKPVRVILRHNGFRDNITRVIKVGDKLKGVDYSAFLFEAVRDQKNGLQSSHKGWFEVVGGTQESSYVFEEDQNFAKPRLNQLISVAPQKTASELREAKSAAIKASSNENAANIQIQVDKEIAANQLAAQNDIAARLEESKALIAQSQAEFESANGQASSISWMTLLLSLVLIFCSIQLGAGTLLNLFKNQSEKKTGKVNDFIQPLGLLKDENRERAEKLTGFVQPYAHWLAYAAFAIGCIVLIRSIVYGSAVGVFCASSAIVAGLLLNDFSKTKLPEMMSKAIATLNKQRPLIAGITFFTAVLAFFSSF
jgi:hypothetical protein